MKVNEQTSIKKTLLWAAAWLASMVLFAFIFVSKKVGESMTSIELLFVFLVVIFGIISFIIVILDLERVIKQSHTRVVGSLLSALVFFLTLGLGIGVLILAFNILPQPKKIEVQAEKTKYTLLQSSLKIGSSGEDVRVLQAVLKQNSNIYPSGIISGYYGQLTKDAVVNFQRDNNLNQSGEVDESTRNKFNEVYGTKSRDEYMQGVAASTYTQPSNSFSTNTANSNATTDSDPLVNCKSSGCPDIKIKQSECSNQYICCEVGSGNWSWYGSMDKCKQAQSSYHNNQNQGVVNNNTNQNSTSQNSNKVPVFISYGGYTLYCPSQNVSAIQSINSQMESKKSQWASSFNQCADDFRKNDSCYKACVETHTSGFMSCTTSECNNQVSNAYGSCISQCPDVNKACESVYWEQKSLSSQITNLCP